MGIKMKKVKLAVIGVVILVIVFLLYTQIAVPIRYEVTEIKYRTCEEDTINLMINNIEDNKEYPEESRQVIWAKEELPSRNPTDYIKVIYEIKGINTSMFDIYAPYAIFDDIGKGKDNFIYTLMTITPVEMKRFETTSELNLQCFMYVGNEDIESIQEKIKDVKIYIPYTMRFFEGRSKVIDIADKVKIIQK